LRKGEKKIKMREERETEKRGERDRDR